MTRARSRLARLAPRIALGALCGRVVIPCESAKRMPHQAPCRSPRGSCLHEGRKLATDGKFAEACPKFEQSLAIDSGLGTKFNLADCWEHLGRLASAKSMFDDVANHAHESGQNGP